jgi:hypothetical protein
VHLSIKRSGSSTISMRLHKLCKLNGSTFLLFYYYYYYILQLGFHPVAVVLTLVHTMQMENYKTVHTVSLCSSVFVINFRNYKTDFGDIWYRGVYTKCCEVNLMSSPIGLK